MTYIKELTISLCDWETRIILESISREAFRLKNICEHSEDEATADAGNDYLELVGFKERLEAQAIELFGQQVKDFSRDTL